MRRLNKFQFHNLFKQKSFFICTMVILLLGALQIISSVLISKFMPSANMAKINSNESLKMFLNPGQFDILLAIFVSLFFCLDISNGTLKNIIARGYSRTQVFFSRFFVTFVGVTIMFLATFIFSYLITFIVGGKIVALDSKILATIGVNYIVILGIASFYGLVSTIISKSSGSLVTCLLSSFLAATMLPLVDTLLKIKNIFSISNYWIVNATNNKPLIALLIGIIYITISLILGNIISKRKEIK